jgi:hypothetical protein
MGRLAGCRLFIVYWEVWRDTPAGRDAWAELNDVAAADELLAKEAMIDRWSAKFPVSEGWEMRVVVRPVNDDLVIELGAELAAARKQQQG